MGGSTKEQRTNAEGFTQDEYIRTHEGFIYIYRLCLTAH